MPVPGNIERLLMFRETADYVWTLEDFPRKYPIRPEGTLLYFGFNQDAVERETALDPDNITYLDHLLNSLNKGQSPSMTAVMGIEPYSPDPRINPFRFILDHLETMEKLARELTEFQQRAHHGKRLNLVLRYASEMNDDSNKDWGLLPIGFKTSFAEVKPIFKNTSIRFSFSPGMRSDLNLTDLLSYWPDKTPFDLIGGTWYVNIETDLAPASQLLRDYVRHFQDLGLPFGLDEMGGVQTFLLPSGQEMGRDNDSILSAMFEVLRDLATHKIEFEYVGLFLQGKLGIDATLDFLK